MSIVRKFSQATRIRVKTTFSTNKFSFYTCLNFFSTFKVKAFLDENTSCENITMLVLSQCKFLNDFLLKIKLATRFLDFWFSNNAWELQKNVYILFSAK